MTHTITYMARGHDDHVFRCRCGATCESKRTKQMVEDEVAKHLDLVARVRKPRTTTLDAEYRHAKQMSEDINVDRADRDLWAQLASSLGERLGLEAPPSKQEELFTL